MQGVMIEHTMIDFDPAALGPVAIDWYEQTLSDFIAWRRTQPADRFIDIRYTDLVERPLEAYDRVLRGMGLTVTDRDMDAARTWMGANGRDTHPPHRYHIEDYGIANDEIARRFAFYHDIFL